MSGLQQHNGQMNCNPRRPILLPFIIGGNQTRGELYTAVAMSSWSFNQTDSSARSAFALNLYQISPVEGVLVVEHPNAYTSIQYLNDVGDARYELSEVLTVGVRTEDGQYIAQEAQRGWYGYGPSEESAVAHLASSLVEELEGLTEREADLSEPLHEQLRQLRSVVTLKP